jgi:hypothetical protein
MIVKNQVNYSPGTHCMCSKGRAKLVCRIAICVSMLQSVWWIVFMDVLVYLIGLYRPLTASPSFAQLSLSNIYVADIEHQLNLIHEYTAGTVLNWII